jgi:arginine decarboxylase
MKSQKNMPYVSSVEKYVKERRIPFHMPGHKQGQGVNSILHRLWGKKIFDYDLTEVDGLDYVNAPTGVIAEAEKLAAKAFNTEETFFLINGSTVGNQAAIMSLVGSNEKILVGRNSHQSTYAGLILSGAVPVYAKPTLHKLSGFYPVIGSKEINTLLNKNKDIIVVHLTSPTHIGFMPNIEKIRELTQKKNIPLIVDEAHGSHFQFHEELPTSAIALGADIVIQSTHKTIGSLTQTSMLHLVKTNHVSGTKLQSILRLLQSSSPSTLFVMSLDAARYQMANEGERLLTRTLQLSRQLRRNINSIEGLYCYGKEIAGTDDIVDIDETKILINISKTGYTGYELEKILGREYKIEIEMSDTNHILCFVTIGDTEQSINKLISALESIANNPKKTAKEDSNFFLPMPGIPELALTPRDAFFAQKKRISLMSSLGQISGEFIIPFPPDIPIIVPGERINQEILDYVKYLKKNDTMIVGPEDTTLETIEVI